MRNRNTNNSGEDGHNPINSLLQEVEFWKNEIEQANHASYITAAKEIYKLFQNVHSVFQFLHENTCAVVSNHDCVRGSSKSDRIFDFLERHFTDGNIIETTLYSIFQITNGKGQFVYSARVSVIIQSCQAFLVYIIYH